MKKTEINSNIIKYIQPFNNKYMVHKYIMYQKFDDYFIKGYLFYSKGDQELGLKVTYFVTPLFIKDDAITYVLGEEILNIKKINLFKKTKDVWWDTRKENQVNTFKKINEAILEQGEIVLNRINTAKEFSLCLDKEKQSNIRAYEICAYSAILFEEKKVQDKLLLGLIRASENERDVEWVQEIKMEAENMLNKHSQDDRVNLLKTWANVTIDNLKLPGIQKFEFNNKSLT